MAWRRLPADRNEGCMKQGYDWVRLKGIYKIRCGCMVAPWQQDQVKTGSGLTSCRIVI